MNFLPPHCSKLSNNVNAILDLVPEAELNNQIRIVESSLAKAIAPKFEIVFAGAFSAGKSMLINALLERELLYSAEGHATGTECYIEYAEPEDERVVLTFLSEAEIKQQATVLYQHLGLFVKEDLDKPEVIDLLLQACAAIIEKEGGASKSERAKKANALDLLLKGYQANRAAKPCRRLIASILISTIPTRWRRLTFLIYRKLQPTPDGEAIARYLLRWNITATTLY